MSRRQLGVMRLVGDVGSSARILPRELAARRLTPRGVSAVTTVVVAAVAGCGVWWLLMRPVPPLDFNVFYDAGVAVRNNHSPYPSASSVYVWSGSSFVYPYLSAVGFSTLALIEVHVAQVLWAMMSIAAIALGVWLLAGPSWQSVLLVLIAAPTLDGLQMGTVNALLFLGLAAAWRCRNRTVVVGTIVAALVALKLFLWPLFIWLILSGRWRASVWAVIGCGLVLTLGFAVGPVALPTYMSLLTGLAHHEVAQTSGLQGMLVTWKASPQFAEMIGLVAGVGALLAVARRPAVSESVCYGATIVTALVASPIVWHHYYLLLAIPLLVVPHLRRAIGWYTLVGWASVAPHAVGSVSVVPAKRVGSVVPIGTISLAPAQRVATVVLIAAVAGMAIAHRDRIRAEFRTIVALAGAASAVIAVVGTTAGLDALLHGISQAGLSILATAAVLVALLRCRRTDAPSSPGSFANAHPVDGVHP